MGIICGEHKSQVSKYKNVPAGPAMKRPRTEPNKALSEKLPELSVHNAVSRAVRGTNLPLRVQQNEFLEAFQSHATVVLVAETGSGKSTQVN